MPKQTYSPQDVAGWVLTPKCATHWARVYGYGITFPHNPAPSIVCGFAMQRLTSFNCITCMVEKDSGGDELVPLVMFVTHRPKKQSRGNSSAWSQEDPKSKEVHGKLFKDHAERDFLKNLKWAVVKDYGNPAALEAKLKFLGIEPKESLAEKRKRELEEEQMEDAAEEKEMIAILGLKGYKKFMRTVET